MTFYVGAYGMSPCTAKWNPDLEAAYLEGLQALPFVRGLELPHYATTLDRWDEDFFFRHAGPQWDYIVTTLPALSGALRDNPAFGLASTDVSARQAALAGIRATQASVKRAHDRLGRRAIHTVEVQSGPSLGWIEGTGNAARFADSLSEIAQWDWDGADIVVEHCDAAVPGQAHEKGFLRIEDEIRAIETANTRGANIGGSINWGRSGIELRDGRGVPAHVEALVASGLYRGMIFSGCSGADTPFGAWKDTHMPPEREPYTSAFAAGSLLTEQAMREALAPARSVAGTFLGVKIAARPLEATVPERLELLRSALTMLATAVLKPA